MRKIYFFMLLIFAFACGGEKTIPERKLVKILAEMHLIDAALEESGRSFQRDSTAVYTAILENYGYTVTQFYSSLAQYARSKSDADKLYDKVGRRLNKLKAQREKEVEAQRKKQLAISDTAQVEVVDSAAILWDSTNIFTDSTAIVVDSASIFTDSVTILVDSANILREEKQAEE